MSDSGLDLNDIPAGTPPAGQTSNLIDPPSLQNTTIAVLATLMAVATICVLARVWFNVAYTRRVMTDDIFTILGLIFSVTQSAVVLSISKTERHQWDLPLSWYDASYFKRSYAQAIIAWPAIFFSKVAILFLFRRVFGVVSYMGVCTWIGMAWAVITYVPNIFVESYYCAPHVGGEWDLLIGERCSDPLPWEIASASMSIMLDIFILVIPMPLIRTLRVSKGRRIGIQAMFLAATLAVVCAILTLVYRIQIFLGHNNDAAWETAQLYICNGAENYTAIIVGCVPGVSSFFRIYVAEFRLYSTIADTLLSRFSPTRSKATNSKDSSENANNIKPSKPNRPGPWSIFDTNTDVTQPKSQHEGNGTYLELRDAGNLAANPLQDQYQYPHLYQGQRSKSDIEVGISQASLPE